MCKEAVQPSQERARSQISEGGVPIAEVAYNDNNDPRDL